MLIAESEAAVGQALGNESQSYAMVSQTISRQATVMAYNEGFLLVGVMLFIAALASLSIRPPAPNAVPQTAGAH
ncbi:MAG: hypothetical protein WAO12_11750 [Venatoribacter sp.]